MAIPEHTSLGDLIKTCPNCKGKKQVVVINHETHKKPKLMDCTICGGTGQNRQKS